MLWNDIQPILVNLIWDYDWKLWNWHAFRSTNVTEILQKSILLIHKGNLVLSDTTRDNNLWQIMPEPIQTEDTLQDFFFPFGKVFTNLYQLGTVRKLSWHLVCLKAKDQIRNWVRGADPTHVSSVSVKQTFRVWADDWPNVKPMLPRASEIDTGKSGKQQM